MSVVNFLKSLPIDVGQGNQRFETKGKLIALDLIPKNGNGKKILDIGCREGAQSEFFKSLGYEVTSIDIEVVYEGADVINCNEKLPYFDESFDIVWSSEVIEHLIDPVFSLGETRRILKKGGKLIYTTPNSFPFYFCLLAIVGLTPQRIQRKDHIHFLIIHILRDCFLVGFFMVFFLLLF